MVALGTKIAGLFGNDDPFAQAVQAACGRTGERAWRMPLDDDFREALKSHVADLKNVGGKWGGAITAAKFLQQFVGETPWVHLDIAGPSWADSDGATRDAGGTGCYVRIARRAGRGRGELRRRVREDWRIGTRQRRSAAGGDQDGPRRYCRMHSIRRLLMSSFSRISRTSSMGRWVSCAQFKTSRFSSPDFRRSRISSMRSESWKARWSRPKSSRSSSYQKARPCRCSSQRSRRNPFQCYRIQQRMAQSPRSRPAFSLSIHLYRGPLPRPTRGRCGGCRDGDRVLGNCIGTSRPPNTRPSPVRDESGTAQAG